MYRIRVPVMTEQDSGSLFRIRDPGLSEQKTGFGFTLLQRIRGPGSPFRINNMFFNNLKTKLCVTYSILEVYNQDVFESLNKNPPSIQSQTELKDSEKFSIENKNVQSH